MSGMTFCKHCVHTIDLRREATAWHHKFTGLSECFPRDPSSPVAEPAGRVGGEP